MARVLGLDPGSIRFGYGVIDTVAWSYLECGVLEAKQSLPRDRRLGVIGNDLRSLLRETHPDAIAMENAFYSRNAQTTLALGEARGVALFLAADAGLPVSSYAPTKVKQVVTGSGAASKAEVMDAVVRLLRMKKNPPLDASDALAVAVCHARSAPQ